MIVVDPFLKRRIVVGKEVIARIYTAFSIRNEGLQCIFHAVETNLQGRRYEDLSEAR